MLLSLTDDCLCEILYSVIDPNMLTQARSCCKKIYKLSNTLNFWKILFAKRGMSTPAIMYSFLPPLYWAKMYRREHAIHERVSKIMAGCDKLTLYSWTDASMLDMPVSDKMLFHARWAADVYPFADIKDTRKCVYPQLRVENDEIYIRFLNMTNWEISYKPKNITFTIYKFISANNPLKLFSIPQTPHKIGPEI